MNVPGCWTCKIRKKKCDIEDDRTFGSCRTCTRLKLECLGFGMASRPQWIGDKLLLNSYRNRSKEITLSAKRLYGVRARVEDPGSLIPLMGLSSSSSSKPLFTRERHVHKPHPHDYQPALAHTTTRESAALYWGVTYRYYYPDVVEFRISGVVDAIMRHAPLSPMASLVAIFPELHTEATMADPARRWAPSDSEHAQVCHRLVARFTPGRTRVTDDHIVAAQYLLGFPLMSAAAPVRSKVLAALDTMLKHSSMIPGQRLRERGPLMQVSAFKNGRLLSILKMSVDGSNDREIRDCLGSMFPSTQADLESICTLSRWHAARKKFKTSNPAELLCRGHAIQQKIYSQGFHVAQKIDVALSEDQLCEDLERAGCLLYLQCVLDDFGSLVPEIIARIDLFVWIYQQLPLQITPRHAKALMFPFTLSAALNQNPAYPIRAWLDDFIARNCVHVDDDDVI